MDMILNITVEITLILCIMWCVVGGGHLLVVLSCSCRSDEYDMQQRSLAGIEAGTALTHRMQTVGINLPLADYFSQNSPPLPLSECYHFQNPCR